MPKTLHYFTDGATVKNIDLPQYPDSAWNWITGNPDDTSDEQLYSRVSAVYRVANMTADACANVPFAIMRGETEVDNSESWQNIIGFMENPRELLRLWRLSLFMTNSAYGLLEDGARQRSRLRYIVPTSITPVVDKWNGLTGFTRQLGSEKRDYSLKDGRIFWMWRLDHTTELLPSDNSEFKALMAAAGVLYYADYYVQNFFQRGGIKPALLQVSGVQTREEREKIESVWDKIVHGWYKYLGKVISADTMDVKTIGDGIDNLTGSQLHDEKLADIAMAAGMPLSLILANSANYATAQTEYAVWFRDTVTPWLRFIEGELNSKLFAPMGLRWEFRPEASDHGQEEEVQRASAYASYVSAGMKPSIAAQVLGIELPEGVEYEQLDPEPEPEPEPAPVFAPEPEVEDEEKSLPTVLTIEQLRELEHWQDIAFRKLKQGKSLDFPWVCKVLPEEIAIGIRARLPECRTEKDIERAFEMNARDGDDDALKALADALNRAVEKVMPVAEASEAISA
ncbi:MAG: phage portal protein [Atribacterota bacterium]